MAQQEQARASADARENDPERAWSAGDWLDLEAGWLEAVAQAWEKWRAWLSANGGPGFHDRLAGEPGRELVYDLARTEMELAAQWASEHGRTFEDVWGRFRVLRLRNCRPSPFQVADDARQGLIRDRQRQAWRERLMREQASPRRPPVTCPTAPTAAPHRARAKRSRPQRRRSRAPGDDDPDGGPGERAACSARSSRRRCAP